MKKGIIITLLCFLAASGSLYAIIDLYVEIAPSKDTKGYHTKIELEKQKDGRLLLTLQHLEDSHPGLQAWLVVCTKERGKGSRNFRYEVDWRKSSAKKKDIELVSPVRFGDAGVANLQLTEDLASRSYIVFGGFFDDGTFYTVDIPAFQRNLDKKTATRAVKNVGGK